MNSTITPENAAALQGNWMSLGDGRAIAIYLREGKSWVAEFGNDRAQICPAGTWFQLNRPGFARRRLSLSTLQPLSDETAARIECLHAEAVILRHERALRGTWLHNAFAWLRRLATPRSFAAVR